jgi:hypothetical protein
MAAVAKQTMQQRELAMRLMEILEEDDAKALIELFHAYASGDTHDADETRTTPLLSLAALLELCKDVNGTHNGCNRSLESCVAECATFNVVHACTGARAKACLAVLPLALCGVNSVAVTAAQNPESGGQDASASGERVLSPRLLSVLASGGDESGETPAHVAASLGLSEFISILQDRLGVEQMGAADDFGRTPAASARANGFPELAKTLDSFASPLIKPARRQ